MTRRVAEPFELVTDAKSVSKIFFRGLRLLTPNCPLRFGFAERHPGFPAAFAIGNLAHAQPIPDAADQLRPRGQPRATPRPRRPPGTPTPPSPPACRNLPSAPCPPERLERQHQIGEGDHHLSVELHRCRQSSDKSKCGSLHLLSHIGIAPAARGLAARNHADRPRLPHREMPDCAR